MFFISNFLFRDLREARDLAPHRRRLGGRPADEQEVQGEEVPRDRKVGKAGIAMIESLLSLEKYPSSNCIQFIQ